MTAYRLAFVLCVLSLIFVASVQAQEWSLDDAKTIQDVVYLFEVETSRVVDGNYQTHETFFKQANKKIAELARAGADVDTVVKGFKSVAAVHRNSGIFGSDDYDPLWLFLNELEKTGTHLDTVAKERYWMFTENNRFIGGSQTREKTLADFERIMAGAKKWASAPPPGVDATQPIQFILDLSNSYAVREAKLDLGRSTVERLIEFAQSDEMMAPPEAKKEVVEFLQKHQRRQVGSDPKLYGQTLDDKEFKWEDLRGKYVLIKFTATWCGPCKMEIPGMLEAYEKYKDKGLEIVSVYIAQRESDPVATVKKAVEEEKLPWIILSEALTEQAKQPKHLDFYAIRSVPTMLLVDKEGKIITTSEVRGELLKAKLAEIFK